MKILLIPLLIILSSHAFSQACQEIVFTDSTESKQLIEYKIHLRNNRYTIKSLGGVIVLYRFENKGDKCWRLKYYVDDTCLDECPTKYSYFNGVQIILIHDADADGKPLLNHNCLQTKACIQEVVQGWLYIHPRKDKWMVYTDLDGNSKRVNISKQPRNGGDDSYTIRFKKDGSVVPF